MYRRGSGLSRLRRYVGQGAAARGRQGERGATLKILKSARPGNSERVFTRAFRNRGGRGPQARENLADFALKSKKFSARRRRADAAARQ
eukprot:1766127-Prymnesium_polylepis.1